MVCYYTELSARTFRGEELVKGIHLNIYHGIHGPVLERDIHLNAAIQMKDSCHNPLVLCQAS